MSGPGNSGSSWVNPSPQDENCAGLIFNTNLASPQSAVINDLEEGDLLNVKAVREQGPIQAFDAQDRLAGSIISRQQVRLLNCINGGTEYVAQVLSIEGGQCNVEVRAI